MKFNTNDFVLEMCNADKLIGCYLPPITSHIELTGAERMVERYKFSRVA